MRKHFTILMSEHSKALGLLVIALVALFLTTGCAAKSRTYKETTTVSSQSADSQEDAMDPSTQTTTTVQETETTSEPPSRGILSTTVHVIGEIIAFPFKLIGGLFSAIF